QAPVGQRATLTHEDPSGLERGPALQVGWQCPTCWQWERGRALLIALSVLERGSARAFPNHQVADFELYHVAGTSTREQQQVKDRIRPHVAPQLDLPKQPPYLCPVEALRGELLALQFLHLPDRFTVRCPSSTSQV